MVFFPVKPGHITWVRGGSRGSSVVNTPTAELPTERRKNDQLEKSSSIQDSRSQPQASTLISAADTPRALIRSFSSEALASIDCFSSGVVNTCHSMKSMMLNHRSKSLSFLVRKHGDKAGLLFTDAAHELLDCSSPVLSRSCSVVSRACSRLV